ncbi:hypothetical protein ACJRO7_018926 [Eucalyptus globulus]|uniref:Uncharacterized protein n=1 Tax=Eucalyptus globulus TaxID=34317 RepID=A0ABD3KZP1_EUCGL
MSITYCLLVFIIMGLSLHICDARRLTDMDKKPVKGNTSSSKSGLKTERDLVNITSNFQSMQRNNSFDNEGHNAENLTTKKPEKAIVQTRTTQKLTNVSSLVSVSWVVPRKIPNEKHPGLDSDYSPPKTHPPSHN